MGIIICFNLQQKHPFFKLLIAPAGCSAQHSLNPQRGLPKIAGLVDVEAGVRRYFCLL